ncbi:diaminopropionate ammonia-lyase [Candidatus Poriferisodalis sp.]|uniref:diaminopropionate ammonia-lyase n=1 Tax=Candidatus Poriferisodalis sp. TaxID=3101277 RepID=UPI003B0297B1
MGALVNRNPLFDGRDWPAVSPEVMAFHRRLPAYAPTLVVDAPRLADSLGVGRVLVKAETQRMGLPSFKILGASWASYRAVCEHIGGEPQPWANINELAASLAHLRPMTLAAATDGNHGRAVAFMARLLGFDAHILVPDGTSEARIAAIEGESATVTVVDGTYDDAITQSAEMAGERCLVVSDTSWPGYETIPANVAEGYTTIFAEVDDALAANGIGQPDLVAVPVGVGAFMAAAVTHYRSGEHRPVLVSVEPDDANCVQMSTINGEITETPGPHRSIMVGLNCGVPSPLAWPMMASGVDWCVSVNSDAAGAAMGDLADSQVVAGETGSASLAGVRALLADEQGRGVLDDPAGATVLVMVTEGATDPANYERIVGRPDTEVGRVLTAAR